MIALIVFAVLFIACNVAIAFCGGLSNIARGRKYKSGTGWCVWRWTDVDSEYILRLHVVKTPWCAICLHWIKKPDAEPWLHDHPVSFLSVILRGGYTELRRVGDGQPFHKVNRWFNFVRGDYDHTHRIIFVRRNTLTLCFMGPKTREWGFHVWKELCPECTATPGWIMWKHYYTRLKAGEDMRQTHAWFDLTGAFAQVADEKLLRFCQTHTEPVRPFKLEDNDKRLIDEGEPDEFKAEPPTGDFEVTREELYKKVRF